MLRFVVVERPDRDRVEILAVSELADGRRLAYVVGPGGLPTFEPVEPGVAAPPLLILERHAYGALKEALRSGPPTSPEQDALLDARSTRDRLLSMVETEWASRQLEKP